MTKFRQHRGNADGVRQELQKKHGLMVSLRTVERAVQPWRQQLDAEARATVRFETAPGQQLLIDFGASPGGWRIWKRRNELCAELGRRSSRFPLRNALLMALEDYLEPAQIIVLRERCARPYAPHRLTLDIPVDARAPTGLLAEQRASSAPVTAYICSRLECLPPIMTLAELDAELAWTGATVS